MTRATKITIETETKDPKKEKKKIFLTKMKETFDS